MPVQNFTCMITFIVHHQKFSVFCIFTLPVHALFLLLFFTCNEMSKVHKICLYLINKHSCYIGILLGANDNATKQGTLRNKNYSQ